ncbi:MAG: hypothetical protein GX335_02475 [Firmicutes bacterium]|nr:hypothetical protein [Bacillota bacterium]
MNTPEVFALDIGTRKIAGLLMSPTEEGFVINHGSLYQQLPKAMADGQIHHIDAVTKIISRVKKELEEKSGRDLKQVAVAAAGRSLITRTGRSSIALRPNQRLSASEVKALELEAVWSAIKKLSADGQEGVLDSYLCVGYSTVHYYLDQEPIGSLLGHQGREGQVEVIATFLPRIVINSLGTALENAGLEMASLTLEPIAAMHIVVPATMRMLNIALVDIGAGTSDLAISAQGTVRAYGMVSSAGDQITKEISNHFLLDLAVAEQVKVNLRPGKTTRCRDVFGNELALSYEQILEVIHPKTIELTEKIAQEILRLNDGPPKGIILIGGGSLTPKLAPLLAKILDLPENLVRVRDRTNLPVVEGAPHFSGPEIITPIGIGCTYLDGLAMELTHVTVNDEKLQFLKLTSSTVGDALVNSGLTPADLIGRPGPAYTVEINNRCVSIPGTMGKPALILKNEKPAELETNLNEGDQITVTPGVPGKSPQITVGEFVDAESYTFEITLNGSPLTVEPILLVNKEPQNKDYLIQDRDKITLQPITNIRELLQHLDLPLQREIRFKLNGKETTALEKIKVLINGKEKPLQTALRQGQNIEFRHEKCTLGDICRPAQGPVSITVTINEQPFKLSPPQSIPLVNGEKASFDQIIKQNDVIEYQAGRELLNSFIVTDIFRDYQPEEPFLKTGGKILVNGEEAGFTTPLKNGDKIELISLETGEVAT